VPVTKRHIAATLAAASADEPTPLTAESVLATLVALKDSCFSPRYTWSAAENRPVPSAGTRVSLPMMLETRDATFFAIELFARGDPLLAAFEYIHSRYTPAPRTFVRGVVHSEARPYLLATRVDTPAPPTAADHTFIDYSRQVTPAVYFARDSTTNDTPGERARVQTGSMTLTAYLDELSRRARAEALYLDPNDPRSCDTLSLERRVRERDNTGAYKHAKQWRQTYPDMIVNFQK